MMKPFYQDEQTILYCGDNEDVLPYWAERSVDVVITDPPFASSTHEGARTNPDVAGAEWLSGGNEGQPLITFDAITPGQLRTAFDRMGYLARRWVVASMDWHHYAELEHLPPAFLRPVRFGIWDKPNGAPQFTGDRPAQGWEAIGIFHRAGGRMRWNGGGNRAVWRVNRVSDPYNPTAKPSELIETLIALFSEPGDLILDPYCGTGTTLLAARQLGRLAVGIERDQRQCEEIVRRIQPTFGQPVRRPRARPISALPMFEDAA